jgi:uncharacterized RDD family membrane protein YckC
MIEGKRNKLLIETPEGIAFSLPLASPLLRFLAWLVDVACLLAGSIVLGILAGFLKPLSEDIARSVFTISYFGISIGYGIALEWAWRGQTFGKRLLGLRVMDAQGLKLQFSQVVLRNLLRFVDMLPALYLVGGLSSFLSRNYQRLGDLAANTVVIRHEETFEPDLEQIMAGKYNSFRGQAHLEARLRQRISPEQAALVLQALLRRDQFEAPARVDLFSRLAEHCRELVEFPEETVETLTDEQYLRNVVDVVYRPRGVKSARQGT